MIAAGESLLFELGQTLKMYLVKWASHTISNIQFNRLITSINKVLTMGKSGASLKTR